MKTTAGNTLIKEIPEIPPEIIDASNTGRLVLFVGAGISKLIGCKSWKELAIELINKLYENEENRVSFIEKEAIQKIDDNRKIISICKEIFSETQREIDYHFVIENCLKRNEEKPESSVKDLFRNLYKLSKVIVTTNIDSHFEDSIGMPEDHVFYSVDSFNPECFNDGIYHIHGLFSKDCDNIVFSLKQYLERYGDHKFKAFIDSIFRDYSVLFVGYGLAEFEVLEWILKSNRNSKHYILYPFFSHEEKLLNFEQKYYSNLGISLIPYCYDLKGYDQLIDVIQDWSNKLQVRTNYYPASISEIDLLIRKNNINKKGLDLLFSLKHDKSLLIYFFKELSKIESPAIWLKQLFNQSFFQPNTQDDIPFWYKFKALMSIAKKIRNNSNKNFLIISEIVNNYIKHEYTQEAFSVLDRWNLISILSHMPIKYIDSSHIDYICNTINQNRSNSFFEDESMDRLIVKLIDGKFVELIIKLFGTLLEFKKNNKDSLKKYESLLGDYYLGKLLSKHKGALSKLCGINIADIALSKITKISNESQYAFSELTIPAIEDCVAQYQDLGEKQQFVFSYLGTYYYQIGALARDMLERAKLKDLKQYVGKFISSEDIMLQRLGFYLINKRYDQLKSFFWNLEKNPLESGVFHEIYELLRCNSKKFTAQQFKQAIKWIEQINHTPDDAKLAYKKKHWLTSLFEADNPLVKDKYEHYHSINSSEILYPGLMHLPVRSGFVKDVDPISETELLKMSNKEILSFLRDYKDPEEISNSNFTRKNLSRTFQVFVSNHPEKISKDITIFIDLPDKYFLPFLRGFSDATRSKSKFSWKFLLIFLQTIIDTSQVIAGEDREICLGEIAEIISNGLDNEEIEFPKDSFPSVEELLMKLLEVDLAEENNTYDLVTHALSSAKGKIYKASLDYSYHSARSQIKESENKWSKRIKDKFSNLINDPKFKDPDFFVILGMYLKSLYDIDKEWVQDNISKILHQGNLDVWKASFVGHISTTTVVYESFFYFMKKYYIKGLDLFPSGDDVSNRIVQIASIAFIAKWENLNEQDSLIQNVLNRNSIDMLEEVVSFVWLYAKETGEVNLKEIQKRISQLWGKIIDLIEMNNSIEKYKNLAVDIGKWLVFYDDLDEMLKNYCKVTARYYRDEYYSGYFIQYLSKHVASHPEFVKDILFMILENDQFLITEDKYIKHIVETLYKNGLKDLANSIYKKYCSKGMYQLKSLYDEYNPPEVQNA